MEFNENVSILQESLKAGFVRHGVYGSDVVNVLRVVDSTVSTHEENKHISLDLCYQQNSHIAVNKEERNMNLLVFYNMEATRNADKGWTPNFKKRLFAGNPPIAVAVDVVRGYLFLIFLDGEEDVLTLRLFAEMKPDEVDAVLTDISYSHPYGFDVPQEVLMDIITGNEGYNHAFRNLSVYLNCTTPLKYQSGLIIQG